MRKPSEWQHLFGPVHSPVTIAGSSERIRNLVAAIRALGKPGDAMCVIVEGGDGCGKSLAAAAFQAACQEDGTSAVLVNEGTEPSSVMPRLSDGDALIVDNLDKLPGGIRKALFERRHDAPSGTLLTVSKLSALESQLLNSADDHHPIGQWDERPEDVLIMASLAWDDHGLSPGLADLCLDGTAEALSRGPWSKGAHSVRRAIAILVSELELDGYFERPPGSIGPADILASVVGVIREEQPTEPDDAIRILVEGSTDAIYIEAAARLAQPEFGADLLSGCRVAPPGEDREGGAAKAVRELLLLEAQGLSAVALFDDDEPGRTAAKDARKFTGQKVHVLPAEFDPLKSAQGTGKTEIEDLVSISVLERFYAANPELAPEETTTRGDLTRIVVAGPDKDVAANWICENATFEDVQKIVYVLCMLRQSLGLPLPDTCPPLQDWLTELRV